MSKKNRFEETLERGNKDRKYIAAQVVSKNGISMQPVHEYTEYHGYESADKNSVINRLMNLKDDDAMGLDYLITFTGSTKKVYTLIRWFDDPEIFIKESSGRKLLEILKRQNVLFLFIDKPRDAKGEIKKPTHYKLLSMQEMSEQGWHWEEGLYDSPGNRNRVVAMAGHKIVRPSKQRLGAIPIHGSQRKDIFGTTIQPSLWNALKTKYT